MCQKRLFKLYLFHFTLYSTQFKKRLFRGTPLVLGTTLAKSKKISLEREQSEKQKDEKCDQCFPLRKKASFMLR